MVATQRETEILLQPAIFFKRILALPRVKTVASPKILGRVWLYAVADRSVTVRVTCLVGDLDRTVTGKLEVGTAFRNFFKKFFGPNRVKLPGFRGISNMLRAEFELLTHFSRAKCVRRW